MSLFQWFLHTHTLKNGKPIIPHFSSSFTFPKFPVTPKYAFSLLLIYKPWSDRLPLPKFHHRRHLKDYLQAHSCPKPLKLQHERAKLKAALNTPEPTQKTIPSDLTTLQDVPQDLQDAVNLFNTIASQVDPLFDYPYDFGTKYKWYEPKISIPYTTDEAALWLPTHIESSTDELTPTPLQIFRDANNNTVSKPYSITDLVGDQLHIALEVIKTCKQWTENKNKKFSPLRLTIHGRAGTGKSTLIHAITTHLRQIFNCYECCAVVAPTGCAAYNVCGKTIHSRFSIPITKPSLKLSATRRKNLLKLNKRLVALIIDERSMLDAATLGTLHEFCTQTAHSGQKSDLDFGGIPIVLLLGDDGQLPPVQQGAFQSLSSTKNICPVTQKGFQIFKQLASNVRELHQNQRQHHNETEFHQILDGLYFGNMTQTASDRLLKQHLNHPRFTQKDREQIESNSTFLFATKNPRDEHNAKQLFNISSPQNPVARIRAKNISDNIRNSHFSQDSVPSTLLLCVGAKVSICARNLKSEWGLFNHSHGTVVDIVYRPNESPNHHHLPAYVLVDFPFFIGHTKGHTFLPNYPTYVPIVPIQVKCDQGCCIREQIPLKLAFGKTIHTAQGLTVGPSLPGRSVNPIQSIVVDVGTKAFEGSTPGLSYSAVSRATTLGQIENLHSSALYLKGKNATTDRFLNLHQNSQGHQYAKVLQRNKWVQYRIANTKRVTFSQREQRQLIRWVQTTKYTTEQLDTFIN